MFATASCLALTSLQHKIAQQEQLTKQLRKQQKELKENAVVMTNQKSNFNVRCVCVVIWRCLNILLELAAAFVCENEKSARRQRGWSNGVFGKLERDVDG